MTEAFFGIKKIEMSLDCKAEEDMMIGLVAYIYTRSTPFRDYSPMSGYTGGVQQSAAESLLSSTQLETDKSVDEFLQAEIALSAVQEGG